MARRKRQPRWLSRITVDTIHDEQLREHGGLSGLRDDNALESALARPKQKWTFAQRTDLASLAAAYGFGLVRNHPYRDGNKRIGFLAMATFLGINGYELAVDDEEIVTVIVRLASGALAEDELTQWIREHAMKC